MPIRVLLADDSPAVARAVQAALPEGEFVVFVAADGAQASRALGEFEPDAVLAALSLPSKSGAELASELRSLQGGKNPALFFLRGAVEPLEVAKLASIDHDGVILKPFDSQSLAARVRQAVEGRRDIPSLPEDPVRKTTTTLEPPERITTALGLEDTPLERTLRDLVRDEMTRAQWDDRMRDIASQEFKKLLVEELQSVDPKK